jgi:hypothetical protein
MGEGSLREREPGWRIAARRGGKSGFGREERVCRDRGRGEGQCGEGVRGGRGGREGEGGHGGRGRREPREREPDAVSTTPDTISIVSCWLFCN